MSRRRRKPSERTTPLPVRDAACAVVVGVEGAAPRKSILRALGRQLDEVPASMLKEHGGTTPPRNYEKCPVCGKFMRVIRESDSAHEYQCFICDNAKRQPCYYSETAAVSDAAWRSVI